MKKSTKIWYKQSIAWVLIVLMSINSFAAVVGDNDGAAFITKAEFEALKNDFQAQINKYNSSLDNKIDGSIARYLDGIKVKRKTQLKNLVENYADIEWARTWEVYGSYRDWTNLSTSTLVTDTWYKPRFYKAGFFREAKFQLGFCMQTFNAGTWICLTGNVNLQENPSETLWYNNYQWCTPCIWILKCNYDDSQYLLLNADDPLAKVGSNSSYMYGDIGTGYFEYISSNGGTSWSSMGSRSEWMTGPHRPLLDTDLRASWCQTNPIDTDDQVMNLTVVYNTRNNRDYMVKGIIKQNVWQLPITSPVCYGLINENNDDVTSGYWQYPTSQNLEIFSHFGGHIRGQTINQTYYDVQKNHFMNLMFGDDIDEKVNIIRQSKSVRVGSSMAIKTELSDYATVNWYPNQMTIESKLAHGWSVDDGPDTVNYPNPIKIVLKKPYYERASFSELTSGNFKNGTTKIKMGQGLPISTYLTSSGDLSINFDYSLTRMVETLPTDATKIKVDVKKTNFNNNKDDYYRGIVDDGTATIELKNAVSNSRATATANKNTKILIENVKEGDEVWIRIAPEVTTSGVYAKMSNLKVYLESEG